MNNAQIGKLGEDFCCRILEKEGYKISRRNFHTRYGEADIIAENETEILFVEVKTRKLSTKAMPREAVNISKQRKLILTAMFFLQNNPAEKTPRFDVFEIWHNGTGITNYNHLKNAFDLSALGG